VITCTEQVDLEVEIFYPERTGLDEVPEYRY